MSEKPNLENEVSGKQHALSGGTTQGLKPAENVPSFCSRTDVNHSCQDIVGELSIAAQP